MLSTLDANHFDSCPIEMHVLYKLWPQLVCFDSDKKDG